MSHAAVGRLSLARGLGVVSVALAACALSRASDWPQYRGANGDGVSDEEIISAPTQLWTASVGTGYSSVIVCNGRVYAAGHVEEADDRGTDTVWCLDAATGQEIWTCSYGCRSTKGNFGGDHTTPPGDLETAGPRATPATDGKYVFVPSLDGHLFCLDAATGNVVWYRNIEAHLDGAVKVYGYCSSPALYGDKLILDVGGACVALDKATGEELWRRAGGGGWCGAVSPVVHTPDGPSSTFVVFGSGEMVGASVVDGSLLWSYGMGREAMTMPIVSGDKVFFSTYPDSGKCALRTVPGGGPGDWEKAGIMTYHLSNVLTGGYLYVMDNSGTEWEGHDSGISSLKCLDFATGVERWTKDGLGWANVIVAGDELLILRETGELVRAEVNSTDYTEIVAAGVIGQWCWTSPALAGGRLYCRNDKGDIVCLSVAPAVTIQATDPMASETDLDAGTFTVRRVSADNSAPLTVNVSVTGSATEDVDFGITGGSYDKSHVTIPGTQSSTTLTVTPIADGDSADETVVITLESGPGVYTVGWQESATVHITDSDTSPVAVTITAAGADGYALEGGPDTGAFTIARSASASWPLVVDVSLSGTAVAGDYSLVGTDGITVTIPADQTSAVVTLTALDDADAVDEAVIMTVVANATYYTGSDSATVTIVDDDDAEVDGDGDDMDDGWELCYWGDTSENGSDDFDGDGLSNSDEYVYGTDPTDADTDKDDCSDGKEVTDGSNPLSPTSFYLPKPTNGNGSVCGPAGAAAIVLSVLGVFAFARRRSAPPAR